jgi:hypothetical protein
MICKLKVAFLRKKTISNQGFLAQSDEVLFTFRAHFIEAVMKIEKKSNCPEFKYTP